MKQLIIYTFLLIFSWAGSKAFAQCDLGPLIEVSPEDDDLIFCPYDIVRLNTGEFETYQWQYRFFGQGTSWNDFDSANGQNLEISAGEWGGTYFRVSVTEDTCTAVSDSLLIDSYVFAPAIIIQESGQTEFCLGDSTLIQSGNGDFSSYQWFRDFEPIPDGTEAGYWVTESGYYTLSVSPSVCPEFVLNSGVGPTFTFSGPATQPVITQEADQLVSSSGPNYQWLLEGVEIEGANEATYTPTESGNYTVRVSDESDCSRLSEPFAFLVNAVQQPLLGEQLVISPNPFDGELRIFNGADRQVQFELISATGQRLFTATLLAPQSSHSMLLPELPRGIYLAKMSSDGQVAYKKLIKT